MSAVQVHYQPKFSALSPGDRACRHDGPDGLCIGGRVEHGGYTVDATICLRCGRIEPVASSYRHYWDALSMFWAKFGWHSGIGERLTAFANLSTATEDEAFFALIHGLSPEELARDLAEDMASLTAQAAAGVPVEVEV